MNAKFSSCEIKCAWKNVYLIFVLFFLVSNYKSKAQYCTPSGGFSACALGLNDFWITDVNFAGTGSTFSYSGGVCVSAAPYYLNTGYQGDVVEGNAYTLSVSRAGNSYNTYFNVWVDWDNNNVLNNTTPFVENIASNLFLSAGGSLNATTTITVPLGVASGIHRMRVRVQYNVTNANNPCLTTGQAESKDFNLNVISGCIPPTITANVSNGSICEGDSVVFNGNGSSVSYLWSNGIINGTQYFPVATNTYYVIGTDINGCTGIDSVSVIVNTLPLFTLSVSPSEICNGDTAYSNVSSTDSLTFVWNPGGFSGSSPILIPAISTTYTCIATNQFGCSDSNQLVLSVLPLPIAPVITESGGVLNANATGATSYQWSVDGNQINGATNNTFDAGSQFGNYTVIISDSAGCQNESSIFNYLGNAVYSIKSFFISVFPNPFTSEISIQGFDGIVEIELMNAQGKVLLKKVSNNKIEILNTVSFPSGLYLLKVKSEKELINSIIVKN